MTPEQTKAAIAVMQAYVDGKKVQYKHRGSGVWISANDVDPNWLFEYFDYRIAPEPKYRPYNSPAEVPIGQRVRHKASGVTHMIWKAVTLSLIGHPLHIEVLHPNAHNIFSASQFLNEFTFLDGKPCGILEGVQQ